MARLEHYRFGRLTVDGREHTRDLIVLPDRIVTDWWRREGHALAMEDLGEVLDEPPDRLYACPPARRCVATGNSTNAAPRRRCT